MSTSSSAPPSLSLAERDRRWAAVRAMMRERKLDSLLVGGFRAREMYESYIIDDYLEGCVVFPLEGEPVALTWANLRVLRARWSAELGHELWVQDCRVATTGTAAASVVREKGLDRGRIGVVGLESQAPTEVHGAIPATWWREFTEALRGVGIEDVSAPFSELMLVKSAEELALIRYAAEAGEAACLAMRESTEPGVGEESIYAETVREVVRRGIGLRYPGLILNSGPHTLAWGPPRWTTRAERPRRVQRGDLVQAEIMPLCGNQEVQVQMTVALDPIDAVNQKCERVARASYEAGLKVLRPGVHFSDVVEAMAEPLKVAGCWAYTPLVHSISPHYLVGRTRTNAENVDLGVPHVGGRDTRGARDLVVRPNMVFAFEPNACIGYHRVNLGGTVVVTESGCEELNVIPTRVSHK